MRLEPNLHVVKFYNSHPGDLKLSTEVETNRVMGTQAPFTLQFECGDPAPILHLLLYVNVLEVARGGNFTLALIHLWR